MIVNAPAWTRWWQDDLPCQFQPDQARKNAEYLANTLGERFLAKVAAPVAHRAHPILQRWSTAGANAFLELNALAEDLRVLDGVEGIDSVLNDLRDSDRCLPAWHVLHAASLLGRGEEARVIKFFPQTHSSFPDFLVATEGVTLAVEAKLLMTSSNEANFTAFATALSDKLITCLQATATPTHAVVVVKDIDNLPEGSQVAELLRLAVASYHGSPIESRGQLFNLFVEPSPGDEAASADQALTVLCPRSLKEDLRVQDRARDASKQLSVPDVGEDPTIFCLGLNRLQDAGFIAKLLATRFAAGRYRGISGAMLMRSGPHLGPASRGYIDQVRVLRNKMNNRVVPNIPLRSVGFMETLVADSLPVGAVPAYRYGQYQATMRAGKTGVHVPNILDLTQELLR